ncbi:hypothetical protein [Burkholderia ambifaria]|uniref:hypothetical protein n=1 Tax=Burkholderia ambifaria TaxID=152480 RepID=UPI001ABA696E|nr:hypothetical protein [Burkholderia ambifaria]
MEPEWHGRGFDNMRYTALYGSAFEKIEQSLLADGYVCAFACAYDEPSGPVPDLGWTGKECGWEIRRKVIASTGSSPASKGPAAWCQSSNRSSSTRRYSATFVWK